MGVNHGGLGVSPPPRFWAGESWGRRRSRGSREILIYRIIYSKYVSKWGILKRNRISWPEVAVNGQFCLDKRKKRSFRKFCLENRDFFKNWLEKIEIFRKSNC